MLFLPDCVHSRIDIMPTATSAMGKRAFFAHAALEHAAPEFATVWANSGEERRETLSGPDSHERTSTDRGHGFQVSTRLATTLASLAPLSPGPQRLAGKLDGRRQIESLLPLDGALPVPFLMAALAQTLRNPASLGRESSHEIMSFRSIGLLETLGREAGSEGT